MFATVRQAGEAPVELIRYPRKGHALSRGGEPKHIIDRLERIVAWFDRYGKQTVFNGVPMCRPL